MNEDPVESGTLVTCIFRHNACPVGMLHRQTQYCISPLVYGDGRMERITDDGWPEVHDCPNCGGELDMGDCWGCGWNSDDD